MVMRAPRQFCFTGEMVFPWMCDDLPRSPFKEVTGLPRRV
jgi:hypothetical protein